MKIENQPVVVVGGGSGLGEATARAFAAKGAKVAVLDVNKTAAQKVGDSLNGVSAACDVTDEASVKAAFAHASDTHGQARIVVNCAGILKAEKVAGKAGPASLTHFQDVVNVNLVGSFNVLRLAADDMMNLEPVDTDGQRGVIINTSSIAAWEGQIGQCAYAASKAGVVGMVLPAARELARFGIRVTGIAPGMAATPMVLGLPDHVKESLEASVPFPSRFVDPLEFANLAVHMAENNMLNGEIIRLDGAVRMKEK